MDTHNDERLAMLRTQLGVSKIFFRIDDLIRIESFGRTKLYEELRTGRLKAKRWGDRPVVALWDLISWFDALPDFTSRSPEAEG